MSNQETMADDESLRPLLNRWRVTAKPPPGFAKDVWRRIERADGRRTASFIFRTRLMNWMTTVLPRPALAGSYVAVLLALGATVGWAQSQHRAAHVSEELSLRYVQSVDPYFNLP